jgi:hypothetical protein
MAVVWLWCLACTLILVWLKQVMIMKQLDHPNIVKLIEVIDDPESDNYYMGKSPIISNSKPFCKSRLLHEYQI